MISALPILSSFSPKSMLLLSVPFSCCSLPLQHDICSSHFCPFSPESLLLLTVPSPAAHYSCNMISALPILGSIFSRSVLLLTVPFSCSCSLFPSPPVHYACNMISALPILSSFSPKSVLLLTVPFSSCSLPLQHDTYLFFPFLVPFLPNPCSCSLFSSPTDHYSLQCDPILYLLLLVSSLCSCSLFASPAHYFNTSLLPPDPDPAPDNYFLQIAP